MCRRLRDVSEEELVALLRAAYGPADVPVGIGDDAAVLASSGSVVATTDTMVLGVDWRDDWSSARDVGAKAVTQNVADVAAMGARPTGLLVTLVASADTHLDWALDLARGVGEQARRHGVPVVGGDLSSAPSGLVAVSITALGDLDGLAPVLRSGAQVGDVVAVGGSLGWSGGGLALYQRCVPHPCGDHRRWTPRDKAVDVLRWYHRTPTCSIGSGPLAARAGATSMIDVSDGLSRDAGRLAAASGVRLDLSPDVLREHFCCPPLSDVFTADEALDLVLHGGEEHSLLATFPVGTPLTFDDTCAWTAIGRVEAGAGVSLDGEPLPTRSWDHFAG